MMYEEIKKTCLELFKGERNFICNAANLSAFLYESLDELNWAGFYMLSNGKLLLGPFIGKPACINIDMGRGVCGSSAALLKSLIVPNVHEFDGHIACDSASNSEIVIPLIFNNKLYGVLDIDSPKFDRFNENDRIELEKIVSILLESSDLEAVYKYYNS